MDWTNPEGCWVVASVMLKKRKKEKNFSDLHTRLCVSEEDAVELTVGNVR